MKNSIKTIILLSIPRSGTSAFFEVMKSHPEVMTKTRNDRIKIFFESNYWFWALKGLEGDEILFKRKLISSFPYIMVPEQISKEVVFKIWDKILKEEGPVIFDKSPFYLSNWKIIELILEYNSLRKSVIFIGLIRNPLDTIVSQYQLRRAKIHKVSMKRYENRYIFRISCLEEIRKHIPNFKIFKYEDIAGNPKSSFQQIFNYCNLKNVSVGNTFVSVSIGRYYSVLDPRILFWRKGRDIERIIKTYGYSQKKVSFFIRIKLILLFLPGNFKRVLSLILFKLRFYRNRLSYD